MTEFWLADENAPFALAIGLMLVIAIFEGVLMLLGAGVSRIVDGLVPDIDLGDLTAGAADAPAGSPNALSRLLGWLHVGRVPALVLLIVFLTSFGLCGYGFQGVASGALGTLLPGLVAGVFALIAALPITRLVGGGVARVMPHDESSAVSTASLVGRIAVVTLGTASRDRPAEARVLDAHRQLHYVRVRPESGTPDLGQGTRVLLLRQEGSVFVAIENTDETLSNTERNGRAL